MTNEPHAQDGTHEHPLPEKVESIHEIQAVLKELDHEDPVYSSNGSRIPLIPLPSKKPMRMLKWIYILEVPAFIAYLILGGLLFKVIQGVGGIWNDQASELGFTIIAIFTYFVLLSIAVVYCIASREFHKPDHWLNKLLETIIRSIGGIILSLIILVVGWSVVFGVFAMFQFLFFE